MSREKEIQKYSRMSRKAEVMRMRRSYRRSTVG
jgi:hypothetical protein